MNSKFQPGPETFDEDDVAGHAARSNHLVADETDDVAGHGIKASHLVADETDETDEDDVEAHVFRH